MNWDNSAEWERDLEMYEQLKRIANALEKLADKNTKKVITTEIPFSEKEQELLNGLEDIQA